MGLKERIRKAQERNAALPAIVREFWLFHQANLHIYVGFKAHTRQIQQAGLRQYSSRTIVSVMRFQHDLRTRSTDGFKLNDHHSPGYARLYIREHPADHDLFELRVSLFDLDPRLDVRGLAEFTGTD